MNICINLLLVTYTIFIAALNNGAAEKKSDGNLFPLILGACVTILGWFVVEFIRKRNEYQKKRNDEKIKYRERQIEELYGPLFNLVEQIGTCEEVKSKINNAKTITPENKEIINAFFQKNYFDPLHQEFNLVLKTKLYLIDGSELPKSFYEYLKHAIQEHVQFTLWDEYGIDTSEVEGIPFPEELYPDIKEGFNNAMKKYSDLTSILENEDRYIWIKRWTGMK